MKEEGKMQATASAETPQAMPANDAVPVASNRKKATPKGSAKEKALPSKTAEIKELPSSTVAENMIEIGGKQIEIKPTKLKYQRNHTALFYKMLEIYPLVDILGFEDNFFGDGRTGDQCLFDWLIAVFDDEQFVAEHYDEFDTDKVDHLVKIFRRINRIDEKEEKLKNVMANQAKKG